MQGTRLWPAGQAPIVVTGTEDADLGPSRLELPPAERARLRPFKATLSEWRTPDFRRRAFVQQPLAHAYVLVQRARLVLQAAGLPHADAPRNLAEATPRGAVFRTLYSGSRA
jgi:hypothetical protein